MTEGRVAVIEWAKVREKGERWLQQKQDTSEMW